MEFSIEEMVEIYYCYGLVDGNCLKAQQHCADRFLHRRLPNNKTFLGVCELLKETGNHKNGRRSE